MLQEVKARGDDGGVWRVAVSGVVMWKMEGVNGSKAVVSII